MGSTEEFMKQLDDPEMLKIMVKDERNRLDNEIVFTEGRIRSNITNSFPCHFHFAGTTSKLLMEEGYFDLLKKPLDLNYNTIKNNI